MYFTFIEKSDREMVNKAKVNAILQTLNGNFNMIKSGIWLMILAMIWALSGCSEEIQVAGFEATVLEMSWYGDRMVPAPLGEAFHVRRLTLRSSQVGAVATAQRARWSHRRRLSLALELLADPVFDVLITGASAFDDLPVTLARLATTPDGALCHVVTYP